MRITCFSSSIDRKIYRAVILRPFTCFMHVGQVIFLSDDKGYIFLISESFHSFQHKPGYKRKKQAMPLSGMKYGVKQKLKDRPPSLSRNPSILPKCQERGYTKKKLCKRAPISFTISTEFSLIIKYFARLYDMKLLFLKKVLHCLIKKKRLREIFLQHPQDIII